MVAAAVQVKNNPSSDLFSSPSSPWEKKIPSLGFTHRPDQIPNPHSDASSFSPTSSVKEKKNTPKKQCPTHLPQQPKNSPASQATSTPPPPPGSPPLPTSPSQRASSSKSTAASPPQSSKPRSSPSETAHGKPFPSRASAPSTSLSSSSHSATACTRGFPGGCRRGGSCWTLGIVLGMIFASLCLMACLGGIWRGWS